MDQDASSDAQSGGILTESSGLAGKHEAHEQCDLFVVGAGPAGLTAGLYGARALLRTIVSDEDPPGGQLQRIAMIDDYPGLQHVAGPDLAAQMAEHALSFGARYENVAVAKVEVDAPGFIIRTREDQKYRCGAVIVCTGGRPRHLGVPGEDEFLGRGVSYCAICDGPFFRGKTVAVAGAGNSAAEGANYLATFADEVRVFSLTPQLTADPILQRRMADQPKITVHYNAAIKEIGGGLTVEWIRVRDLGSQQDQRIPVSGVFVYIGFEPQTKVFPSGIQTDAQGFVVTDSHQQTAVPGLFVAGDIHSHPVRHITNACADGLVAALFAYEHLRDLEAKAQWKIIGPPTQ